MLLFNDRFSRRVRIDELGCLATACCCCLVLIVLLERTSAGSSVLTAIGSFFTLESAALKSLITYFF